MVWKFTLALSLLRKRWRFFMPRPKIDRLLLVLIPIILPLLLLSSPACAEIKTFVEEYTYQASEADSKISSRVIALEQVKRLLLEKLGTYLESETEVKNFQLTKDQIVILTAGIVGAEIIDERWDGKTYSLRAKITADPKEVIKSIDLLRQDRQKTKELEETRKKADEALREVEKLRKELEVAKAGKTEQGQYNEAVNRLSATDWCEKGNVLAERGKWKEAMEAFTKAIELDPKGSLAYGLRGITYYALDNYKQAVDDLNAAIKLNPTDVGAWVTYTLRGEVYRLLGNYKQATEDYDKAIEKNSEYAKAYDGRGLTYGALGNYKQAIDDFNKAVILDPKLAKAYTDRGATYEVLGNHKQAMDDYNEAIKVDPKCAWAYGSRGGTYYFHGNYIQAIDDLDKALAFEQKPKLNAFYYYVRGCAYGALGNRKKAIQDFDRAIELNTQDERSYYERGNNQSDLGNYNMALEDYNAVINLNPKNSKAYISRGGIYGLLERYHEAIRDFEMVMNLTHLRCGL